MVDEPPANGLSANQTPYTSLPPRISLPRVDRDVLAFWHAQNIFQRSLDQTAQGPHWGFYEGPPTANGMPGTHHVEARVFKDVFPRFKTMKGWHVPRKGGWDCHGLPVEVAVEKELGISGKQDIEKIGIEEFNNRCRASVQRYVGEFEELTTRIGYWVDLSDAYWTMTPDYIDSVWWAIKQISDKGLLVQDHRVTPYCPRCGTGLSNHEVAQGYETITTTTVYVRLPVIGELAGIPNVELLIWTTTPWTLVSNTAVAVHPDINYVVARTENGTFVVAEALLGAVLGENAEVLARLHGRDLEGVPYQRPFELVDIPQAHYVVTADYVTTEDGTGLVHQAPAFGADDLTVGRRYGLPVVNPIAPNGHFLPEVGLVGGQFFKDADKTIIADLAERGLLYRKMAYEHSYPHCWRCHTPLMYYAQLSWYIRTTAIKAELHRENERTRWFPDHIKHGRFGDWLDNNVDWALSRNRYWGTPLPLWKCENGHFTCVGARSELSTLTGKDLDNIDPHRPYIDDIVFPCPDCGQQTTRVSEVIDAWFDSGAMPFASIGYPYLPGSVKEFTRSYPAQFIAEAIDQTRGWFYTLMAVGTLVFDRSSYENVICLGHIMAEDGRKMSKHIGNIIEPIPLVDKHGADPLRWFMLCSGSPWSARRIGDAPIEDIVRKVLLTYWNTTTFFTLYASTSNWVPGKDKRSGERPLIDRWILAELNHVVSTVDQAMEEFDTADAGRVLAQFIDDLSNWYVRRSRNRFWDGEPCALETLLTCLNVLTRLLAPFVPFIAEHVWQQVIRPGDPDAAESVHLASWPVADESLQDNELRVAMSLTRRLVEVGRAARKASDIRIRQPLQRALISVPAGQTLSDELIAEIADELNVREISSIAETGELMDVTVKANFRSLGKRFAAQTQHVAKAITAAVPGELVAQLRVTGQVPLTVGDEDVLIFADDVLVTEVPRTGWAVVAQQEVTVALDTTITPELRKSGIAREMIRLVQNARKEADFEVSDRIRLSWSATGEVAEALREHKQEIADAVLAVEMTERSSDKLAEADTQADEELGVQFQLDRVRG